MRPMWASLLLFVLFVGCVAMVLASCRAAKAAQVTQPDSPVNALQSPVTELGPVRPLYGYLRPMSAWGPYRGRGVVVVVQRRPTRVVVVRVR